MKLTSSLCTTSVSLAEVETEVVDRISSLHSALTAALLALCCALAKLTLSMANFYAQGVEMGSKQCQLVYPVSRFTF